MVVAQYVQVKHESLVGVWRINREHLVSCLKNTPSDKKKVLFLGYLWVSIQLNIICLDQSTWQEFSISQSNFLRIGFWNLKKPFLPTRVNPLKIERKTVTNSMKPDELAWPPLRAMPTTGLPPIPTHPSEWVPPFIMLLNLHIFKHYLPHYDCLWYFHFVPLQ